MANASRLDAQMFELQSRNVKLVKDGTAQYGAYATLGNVLEVLRPHLNELGLLVEQAPDLSGPEACLTTRVAEVESGDAREYSTPLILDNTTMQKLGSAITYARRYALVSIFLLDADEDDDGNAVEPSKPKVERKSRAKKAESPAPVAEGDKPRVF